MTLKLRYTLVQPPGSVWECGDCGALVVRTSLHDALHAQILALESAFTLLNRQLNPPAQCPCGWKPREGLIGGETLAEHQEWCNVYQDGWLPAPSARISLAEGSPYSLTYDDEDGS
jgi:hypothetical protein